MEKTESLLVVASHYRALGAELTMESIHLSMGCGYGAANRLLAQLRQTPACLPITQPELFAHLAFIGNFVEACRIAAEHAPFRAAMPVKIREYIAGLEPMFPLRRRHHAHPKRFWTTY